MNAPVTLGAADRRVDIRKPIIKRLDIAGNELPDDVSKGHVMSHFTQFGLIFDIRKPKTVRSLDAAHKAAAKTDLLGRKGDWVVGEDCETQLLIDRRFDEPAVDPRIAPNMPESDWIYTATKAKWSPDLVWFVNLGLGYVSWGYDDYEGLVVPVLRVPASQ